MFSTAFISKFILTSTAAAALAASVLPGAAQAGEVQNRINHQQARINQGLASGQLTHGEYNRDEWRLRHDQYARNRDLRQNGGYLTPQERANLNGRLNNNSNDVYFTKHNRADQPGL